MLKIDVTNGREKESINKKCEAILEIEERIASLKEEADNISIKLKSLVEEKEKLELKLMEKLQDNYKELTGLENKEQRVLSTGDYNAVFTGSNRVEFQDGVSVNDISEEFVRITKSLDKTKVAKYFKENNKVPKGVEINTYESMKIVCNEGKPTTELNMTEVMRHWDDQ